MTVHPASLEEDVKAVAHQGAPGRGRRRARLPHRRPRAQTTSTASSPRGRRRVNDYPAAVPKGGTQRRPRARRRPLLSAPAGQQILAPLRLRAAGMTRAAAPVRPCSCRPLSPRRSSCCRWRRCSSARPWSRLGEQLTGPVVGPALRLSLASASVATAVCVAPRRAAGLAAGPRPAARPQPAARPRHGAARAAAGRRRRRAAAGVRPQRRARPPLEARPASRCPSPPQAGGRPRPSWRCPSSCSPWRARCAALDPGYEEVAATLGAGRWHAFRTVTLPLVAPGIAAGAALAWARALGEFGATITFAGSFPGAPRRCRSRSTWRCRTDPEAAVGVARAARRLRGRAAVLRGRWIGQARERLRSPGCARCRRRRSGPRWSCRCRGAGQVVALLGPNGAGKTTALRGARRPPAAMAGGSGSDGGRPDAPSRRTGARVGLVPQDGAAVPAPVGARQRRVRPARRAARPSATRAPARWQWLDRLGSAASADAGRGAVRRASAAGRARPRARARPGAAAARRAAGGPGRRHPRRGARASCAALRRLRRGPTLLVTHDPVDAVALADRLVVLEAGPRRAGRHPGELTRRPGSAWAARLLGWNAWPGHTRAGGVDVGGGGRIAAPTRSTNPTAAPRSRSPTRARSPSPAHGRTAAPATCGRAS